MRRAASNGPSYTSRMLPLPGAGSRDYLRKVGPRDPYSVLGLPRDATPAEIKAVYRQLAKTFHPDVNATEDAEERFKEITEAFLVLCDPRQRASVDAASRKRPRRARPRRSRGEETEIDIGLRLAGIDLGGLVGVHVTVRRRPLFDDDADAPYAPAGLLPEPS